MSFSFKRFHIDDTHCAMKVGTDGVLLGAWADLCGARRVLDIGTGSGLVGMMAAQRQAEAYVVGVEIDVAAASDARRNVENSPFASRMRIVEGNILSLSKTFGTFDHILANPPYHEEDLLSPTATRAAARHTGGGGLTFTALLRCVGQMLDKDAATASFSLILPYGALSSFLPLAEIHGLFLTRRTDVVTREGKTPKRVLLELRRQPCFIHRDTLVLTSPDNKRSEEYARLCREFYL